VTARSFAATSGIIALAAALLAGAVQVQAARERAYPPNNTGEESLYLRSGVTLRRLSGAYIAVAADVYWIRAIQYYGGTKRRPTAPRQGPEPPPRVTGPRATTSGCCFRSSTSPRRSTRASTSPIGSAPCFWPRPIPRGAGRPDLAVALLEKGLRVRPDKWEYLQDIGFVHYWYQHDYALPRRDFIRPARCPARRGGCGRWLPRRWRRAAIDGRRERCGNRSGSRRRLTGCARTPTGGSRSFARSTTSMRCSEP
jgi:hypothetical protein